MNTDLVEYLCDPVTREPLTLKDPVYRDGRVESGRLCTASGVEYPVVDFVPRFVRGENRQTVESFGDQWNHFNFDEFKLNWRDHTIKNTFGSVDIFAGKTIVDAGGGSGAQSLWMLESGAERVILLELSHSVEDVVKRNIDIDVWRNFDVIQCSIDAPPLRSCSIDGIVICHNVIQHTESVENTARALFDIVGPGGEFVFNCYRERGRGPFNWARKNLVYRPVRSVLSRLPFGAILIYSRVMGGLRLVPVLGYLLNKFRFCLTGKIPKVANETWWERAVRTYKTTVLNTFDMYGSHSYQHYKSDHSIRELVRSLQPDSAKVGNLDAYFQRPQPTGIALRVCR